MYGNNLRYVYLHVGAMVRQKPDETCHSPNTLLLGKWLPLELKNARELRLGHFCGHSAKPLQAFEGRTDAGMHAEKRNCSRFRGGRNDSKRAW